MDLETATPWAEGAGGRILKSRDPATGQWVAIKLVRTHDAASAARIRREAQAQSRLTHPNICPVLEVTEYNGEPAIVMPFIEGEALDVAAARLPVRERIALLLPVVDALAAAHADGLVHRDL
jgi:serine/threonine-protein kinase